MALALACFSRNSGAWAAVCSHLHRISSLKDTERRGGRVGARLFSAVRHPPPTQPLIRRASSDRQLWGSLGENLPTLFRPDVTVRGSFCSRSPFICSSCVIFYFRLHPSRTQIVKLGICEVRSGHGWKTVEALGFWSLHIVHEWVLTQATNKSGSSTYSAVCSSTVWTGCMGP